MPGLQKIYEHICKILASNQNQIEFKNTKNGWQYQKHLSVDLSTNRSAEE